MSADVFSSCDTPYLLSHSVGLLPSSAKAYFDKHYFSPWSQATEEIWPQWLQNIDEFRVNISRVLNTSMDQICPQTNISSGLTKLMGSLPLPNVKKKVVLLAEQDFPSMGFVLSQMAVFGFQYRFIPVDCDLSDLQVWQSYLSDDVAAVFITHVQSNTGVKIPYEAICKAARASKIISIVDMAQSLGIIPVNLHDSAADCVLGSCVKWLCGGPGAGFIWLNQSLLQRLEPVDVGWFSHKNPFEFDIHNFEYADDALRFWGGTPSIAPFVIAAHSISVLLEIGLEKVVDHNSKCKDMLHDNVDASLIVSPADTAVQSGTMIMRNERRFRDALDRLKISYDSRAQGIRISPHIYTSMDDMEKVVSCFQL